MLSVSGTNRIHAIGSQLRRPSREHKIFRDRRFGRAVRVGDVHAQPKSLTRRRLAVFTVSLFTQLLHGAAMSNILSTSQHPSDPSLRGADDRIRSGSAPPDRGREVTTSQPNGGASGTNQHYSRGCEALGSVGDDGALAFVGAMPLPTGACPQPILSGLAAGPGPVGLGSGQGWVWAVGPDGPQLVRGNGTALSAYSLDAGAGGKRVGGGEGLGWIGVAGHAGPAMPRHARRSWTGGQRASGEGLVGEQVAAGRVLSPSVPSAASLRGEMVAKLRGLSGRFEVARGPPVNLLIRPKPLPPPQQHSRAPPLAEAEAEAEERGGGEWHAGRVGEGALVQPSSDRWLEEHNALDAELIPHVASLLACAADGGDREEDEEGDQGVGGGKSEFEAARRPKVGLGDYCARMARYGGCSAGCMALAVVYLSRFLRRSPWVRVSGCTVHRLLLTAVLLATKQWDDSHYNNAFWAKVGGVGTAELNALEAAMAAGLRWRMHVDKPEFDRCRAALLAWPAAPHAAAAALRRPAAVPDVGGRLAAAAWRGLRATKGEAAAAAGTGTQGPAQHVPAPRPPSAERATAA